MAPRAFNLVLRIFSDTSGADKADKALKRTSKTAKRTGAELKTSLGSLKGAFAGLGIGVMAREVLRVGSEFQNLRTQLETVTGSAAAASAAFNEIKEFAAETPFQVKAITDSFTNLSAKGFDPTTENLRALGDMAAAFGKDITVATQAVTGAAFGEAEMLKQFGIIMRQEGDKAKITYKGMTQEIEKDSQKIFETLTNLAKVNFSGGMERQSKTLSGLLSTLSDEWKNLLDNTAQTGPMETAETAVRGLTGALRWLRKHWDDLRIGMLIVMKSVIPPVVKGFGLLLKQIGNVLKALALWQEWIGRIIPGLGGFAESLKGAAQSVNDLADGSINNATLMAEGFEIQIQEVFDSVTGLTPAVQDAGRALDNGLGEGAASATTQIAELESGLKLLKNELEATQEYWESDAWEPFAVEKMPDPEHMLDWDRFSSVFGDMIAETMKSRVQEGWEAAMPGVKAQLYNAMQQGADVLAAAVMGESVDFEQAFMDIGKRMGGNIGEGIGYYLGGPAGAMLGRFIGSIIGETAGKFLGKIFGSIFGGSGVAAVARLGNIATPGSGGVPGAGNETPGIENVGSGSGGLDSGGVGLGALASNFQQFTDNLAQLEALIGESISLTESLSIKLMDEGQVFVTLANGMRHEFATAAEAFDFALGYLLKTAELSGQVAPAVEEILRSGMAFEDMVNALNLITGLDAQLLNMGNSVDRAKAALQGALQPFADLKAQINAMGLSAEASAPLLAKVAKAEAHRNKELKVGLLGQLAAWARELGKNIGLQRKVAVLEAKIKFKELKVQLKMLGMWEKYGALARELKNLAIEAARAVGDATKSFGGGGTQGIADAVGDAVRDAMDDPDTYGRPTGTGTAPEDVMASAFAQIGSKTEFKSPFEQLKALYQEQLRYFQGINWGDPEREAAAFEMLTQEFQAAFGRLVAEIQDSLGSFRDTLAEKFGRGTPLEEAADSQTAFNDLLAKALAGDLDALAAIQDAADAALQDAADAFGTSTTAFDDIFSMVMDGLKQLETATIAAPDPTTAINEQTTAVVTSLDVVRTTIQREAEADRAVLLDIRDAISASAVAV